MAKKASDKRVGRSTKRVRSSVANPHLLDDLFEKFYHAKITEGRSKRTLTSYRENYNFFVSYMDDCGVARNVENVTVDLIRDYISFMLQEKVQFEGHPFKPKSVEKIGLSPITVNLRLKPLRTLFKFLVREGLYTENPFEMIKKVEEEDSIIEILTVRQLQSLLEAPNKRSYAGFRDYVLMNLLLDSFCRINEVLMLKEQDIDGETCSIKVRAENSKSKRSKQIPIQKQTLKLLFELTRENKEFETDYIFLANYGEVLTANQFRHRLRDYAKSAGLNCRVHPHLFRHTSATMFLEAGGDIRHLQMLLGHKDLRMVMRYTHLSLKSLTDQHNKYSPLNQVFNKLNKDRKILR
ncbi:tyrosine-type recombinase/integrase [Caldalkalibacillus mannanilyticus]|uniref:tyrosine-type recombinase/integrase n=1 Tax=Caldalkalibacillus mannanilyticus TaxID=1418 RepID=UPI00046878E6|nr:tyrosine-type recombinase/integrase [Caldalkalibacillus mannanilyticus]